MRNPGRETQVGVPTYVRVLIFGASVKGQFVKLRDEIKGLTKKREITPRAGRNNLLFLRTPFALN